MTLGSPLKCTVLSLMGNLISQVAVLYKLNEITHMKRLWNHKELLKFGFVLLIWYIWRALAKSGSICGCVSCLKHIYYFTLSTLGVPKSLIIWDEGKFSECNIKAQKTGFSFFFFLTPWKLAAVRKQWALSLFIYTIVADVLGPLSGSKRASVKCKFNH